MSCACFSGLYPSASAVHSTSAVLSPQHDSAELVLEIKGAKLSRSFAKIGWMSPYAIVTVGGKEAMRTSPARGAHKDPKWGAVLSLQEAPQKLTISVWDQSGFHRDIFCGSATIPCSEDMGRLEMDFELTKRGRLTGTLGAVFVVMTGLRPSPPHKSHSVGTEMDVMISYVNSRRSKSWESPVTLGTTTGSPAPLSLQQGRLSLSLADSFPEAEDDDDDDGDTRGSVVLNLPATDVSPTHDAADELSAIASAGQVLSGPWTCVATEGLESFLKSTGVGVIQRKFAVSARWPSWNFSVSEDRIIFVNHTAIGVLQEEIPLGRDYTYIDGSKNTIASHATWTPTAGGGILLIDRSGPPGKYKEERTVKGNSMEFVLTNKDVGNSWGRSFVRG